MTPVRDFCVTWGTLAADPRPLGYSHGYFGAPGECTLADASAQDPLLKKFVSHAVRRLQLVSNGVIRPGDIEIACNDKTAMRLSWTAEVRAYLAQAGREAAVRLETWGLPDPLYGLSVRVVTDRRIVFAHTSARVVPDGMLVVQTRGDDGQRGAVVIADAFDPEPSAGGPVISPHPLDPVPTVVLPKPDTGGPSDA